jgi:hypothetical protein
VLGQIKGAMQGIGSRSSLGDGRKIEDRKRNHGVTINNHLLLKGHQQNSSSFQKFESGFYLQTAALEDMQVPLQLQYRHCNFSGWCNE